MTLSRKITMPFRESFASSLKSLSQQVIAGAILAACTRMGAAALGAGVPPLRTAKGNDVGLSLLREVLSSKLSLIKLKREVTDPMQALSKHLLGVVMALMIGLAWLTLWVWGLSPYGRFLNHSQLGGLNLEEA